MILYSIILSFYHFIKKNKKTFILIVTFLFFTCLTLEMVIEEFKNTVLPVKNKLYRFALRYLGNEDEAKDVVQEVLIKAWDRREEIQVYKSIEAWCMRLTKNLSLNKLKSGHYSKTQVLDGHDQYQSAQDTPYDSMETHDTLDRIQLLLQRLPEKQRQVLELRDIEGFTYQEISDMLEMELNQVKVNLFRARQTLKKQLISIDAYGLSKNR